MVGSGSQLVGCNSFAKPLSQLKTVAKLIKSSNKNSFMVGGHHPWETVLKGRSIRKVGKRWCRLGRLQ